MPKEFPRSRRISEQVLRVLSTMLRREMNDPRLADVSLTDVELSRDLRHAKVYYSVLHPDKDPKPAGEALNRAAGPKENHRKLIRINLKRPLQKPRLLGPWIRFPANRDLFSNSPEYFLDYDNLWLSMLRKTR